MVGGWVGGWGERERCSNVFCVLVSVVCGAHTHTHTYTHAHASSLCCFRAASPPFQTLPACPPYTSVHRHQVSALLPRLPLRDEGGGRGGGGGDMRVSNRGVPVEGWRNAVAGSSRCPLFVRRDRLDRLLAHTARSFAVCPSGVSLSVMITSRGIQSDKNKTADTFPSFTLKS